MAATEKNRLQRARERVQKAAAKRRVEQKAAANKKKRESEKRRQRIEAGEPEGVTEKAAVASREAKGLAKDTGKLAETAPGGKTLKSLVKGGAAAVGAAASKSREQFEGEGGGSLRDMIRERASGKPITLQSGYEERKNGEILGYYQAGDDGQKFYYVPGNESSRAEAKKQAKKQIPKGKTGSGRPNIREIASQAAVDDSFVSLGTRAEYDPAPPVRQSTDELQPQVGMGIGFGGMDFDWGGGGDEAPESEEGGGLEFRWGEEADEDADGEGGGMFGGFGGMDFKW